MATKEQFAALVDQMVATSDATFGNDPTQGARKMFGSTSIKTGGKMFAFLNKDRLVVKLPAIRVTELVEGGKGEPYDPGHGRQMREWVVVVSESADDWLALATEAEAYVGKRAKR
jgi:TfoX/Sxy family transcriptional regulator of competence genes